MSSIIIYDPLANPANVKQFIPANAVPADYAGRSDVLIDADLSQVVGLAALYWKVESGAVVPMTAQEQSDLNTAIAAAVIASMRSGGKLLLLSQQDSGIVLRALADIIKDELNILRGWITDFKADVAAATSLADLKTRVSANADLPDRTLSQLRTAIENRIDSGSVDS